MTSHPSQDPHPAQNPQDRPPVADEAMPGGDPACWLTRVCPECGRFAEDAPPTTCARCGADLPGDELERPGQ